MSAHNNRPDDPTFTDRLGQRLRWAVLASVLINMGIWRAAAAIARRPAHYTLPPVEISRVILHKDGHKTPKVVTKKQIQKKIAHIRKIVHRPPPPRPRRVVHVVHRPRPVPVPRAPRPRPMARRPPPQGAHHRLIVAKGPGPSSEPQVLGGGNARLGAPIEQQNPGNAVENPPTPVQQQPVAPAPPPKPEPPAPAPAPVHEAPAPPAPAPEPEPAPPPKPRGPTRDALQPDNPPMPQIPDELKQGDYKSFVRVTVEIDEDGSATPSLRTSSGNEEIDRRVLEALRRWRWKPALRDGEPVKSRKLFRFDFEVQ